MGVKVLGGAGGGRRGWEAAGTHPIGGCKPLGRGANGLPEVWGAREAGGAAGSGSQVERGEKGRAREFAMQPVGFADESESA